jgi:hypothetical protein
MRAITHPVAIIATEPNPYSSAPIAAAIRTSTPLLKPPSTLRITLSLSPFATRVYKRFSMIKQHTECERSRPQGVTFYSHVEYNYLMGFCKSKFPRTTGMLNGTYGASSSSTIMP